MHYFYEVFETMPRQGPGSRDTTRRAVAAMRDRLPAAPKILDIGCGTGRQTLDLAAELPDAEITAVDNYQPFLDRLQAQAQAAQITPCCASMSDLPFADHGFDVIWSEGAIYNIGLENGLKAWRRLLRPDGLLGISDIVTCAPAVTAPAPPVQAFWRGECPDIRDLDTTRQAIEQCGYQVFTHFVLPTAVWEENYYQPLEQQIARMRRKYPHNPEAAEVYAELEHEIDMFRQAAGWVNYAFWVLG